MVTDSKWEVCGWVVACLLSSPLPSISNPRYPYVPCPSPSLKTQLFKINAKITFTWNYRGEARAFSNIPCLIGLGVGIGVELRFEIILTN